MEKKEIENLLKSFKMGDWIKIKHLSKGIFTIRFAAAELVEAEWPTVVSSKSKWNEGYVSGWMVNELITPLLTWNDGDLISVRIDNVVSVEKL